jgi:predicted DNA-binding protein (MmcQ/YjbR family)
VPEIAVELREQYTAVLPGYHMNKKDWNTIAVNSYMSEIDILHYKIHSYNELVSIFPKKVKELLQ